jgi:pimeloyl-ACP methyl ester carboxylesterase
MSSSRIISAGGIEIFVLEHGAGPLVVLCHGWPELSYSWRHQIPAIAAAGFRVAEIGRASCRERVSLHV